MNNHTLHFQTPYKSTCIARLKMPSIIYACIYTARTHKHSNVALLHVTNTAMITYSTVSGVPHIVTFLSPAISLPSTRESRIAMNKINTLLRFQLPTTKVERGPFSNFYNVVYIPSMFFLTPFFCTVRLKQFTEFRFKFLQHNSTRTWCNLYPRL